MVDPQVTVVVVPHDRFSCARRSLESIYTNTKSSFSLVYIDGGSPNRLKRYLEAKALEKEFQLIRTEHYLSPNLARNIGLRYVKTEYVIFIDNDVLVSKCWVEALLRCAEETSAWVVGPLYLMGKPEQQIIHMAGGISRIKNVDGKRVLYEKDHFPGMRVRDIPTPLKREPCDLVEFHCMLVRTKVFERLGPMDEKLLSTREHDDFCLVVRHAGGSIFIEPKAVVTYVPPPPLSISDLPFFNLRWSESWIEASLKHFHDKWDLDMDKNHTHYNYLWNRRYLFFWQFIKPLGVFYILFKLFLGKRNAERIKQKSISLIERALKFFLNQ